MQRTNYSINLESQKMNKLFLPPFYTALKWVQVV